MSRIDEFLAVVEDPAAAPVAGADPLDGVILDLLAHVAFADGEVGEEEFTLLSRLYPERGLGEILSQVDAATERPLDVDALARAFPTHLERGKALRFATHMAWQDRRLDPGESQLIRELAARLRELPEY